MASISGNVMNPLRPSRGTLVFGRPSFLFAVGVVAGLALCGASAASSPYHSADCSPADWRIDLSELLEVIQFFNAGEYHGDADTSASGYAAGPGPHDGPPHDSDYPVFRSSGSWNE